jgi:hypothetical protein
MLPSTRTARHRFALAWPALLALLAAWPAAAPADDALTVLRTPGGGIQPQAAVDARGTLHLIYFTGEAKGGDIWYVRQEAGGTAFSPPLRVNSQGASAMAIGSVRGAHLALGGNGRVHVAWMGAAGAEPKAPGGGTPMLYARLDGQGGAFEAQRCLIRSAVGLDGGGSLAADPQGHVEVVWHALAGARDETGRAVYVARSTDDGATFAPEVPATDQATGACGCCGMRACADAAGRVFMLYRAATGGTDRDMMLLASANGTAFSLNDLQGWKLRSCPMSTCAISAAGSRVLLAWQTQEQVFFASIAGSSLKPGAPQAAPGAAKARKHPAIAGNARGETMLVWTEGTAWNQGGTLGWQRYDAAGAPSGERGRADGVPAWGLPTVVPRGDAGFTIIY